MKIVCLLFLVVLVLIYEFIHYKREHRVHALLGQPLTGPAKTRSWYTLMFFLSAFFSLLFAFVITATHQLWAAPRRGVAFVVDVPDGPKSREDIDIAKSTITNLAGTVLGVPCSLYELRGNSLHLVVPMTVDRIFFNLLLDGVRDTLSGTTYTMADGCTKIREDCAENPWVVFVGPKRRLPGGRLEATSYVQATATSIGCTTFDGSKQALVDASLEGLAARIGQRLQKTLEPVDIDPLDKALLTAVLGVSLLCYVTWRRIYAPLLFLSVCVLAGFSPGEINQKVNNASAFVEEKNFDEALQQLLSALSETVEPIARGRLLYDVALVHMRKENYQEALSTLELVGTKDEETSRQVQLFTAAVFSKIIVGKDGEQRLDWQRKLQQWLASASLLSREERSIAEFPLLLPLVVRDEVLATLLWLDFSSQMLPCAQAPFVSGWQLLQRYDLQIQEHLKTTWSSEVLALFSRDMNAISSLSEGSPLLRLRIWYQLGTVSFAEGVQLLLNEAVIRAHYSMLFAKAPAEADLAWLSTLLFTISSSTKSMPQEALSTLLAWDPTAVTPAAKWYARACFWNSASETKDVQNLLRVLCDQYELHVSQEIEQSICQLAQQLFPIFSVSQKVDLKGFIEKVVLEQYVKDPAETLGVFLDLSSRKPEVWLPFLVKILSQATKPNVGALQSAVDRVYEGCLRNLDAFNPLIVGRLWQVLVTSVNTQADLPLFLRELEELYTAGKDAVDSPTPTNLAAVAQVLMCSKEVASALAIVPVFPKNPQKKQIYDSLVFAWAELCAGILDRFSLPTTLRLPKISQELGLALEKLEALRALFEEGSSGEQMLPQEGVVQQQEQFVEDPIRLFQELDQSDRELYGM